MVIVLNLNSSSSFQILFDLCSMFTIVSFQFCIEFHVSFIDIINVSFVIMCSSPTKFVTFCNPKKLNVYFHLI